MPSEKNTITIHCGNKRIKITATDIIYMKGYGNYTFLNTIDGQCYLFSKTMKDTIEKLGCPFIRIHKSYSINPDYFVRCVAVDSVLLANGQELPVARRRIFKILDILI